MPDSIDFKKLLEEGAPAEAVKKPVDFKALLAQGAPKEDAEAQPVELPFYVRAAGRFPRTARVDDTAPGTAAGVIKTLGGIVSAGLDRGATLSGNKTVTDVANKTAGIVNSTVAALMGPNPSNQRLASETFGEIAPTLGVTGLTGPLGGAALGAASGYLAPASGDTPQERNASRTGPGIVGAGTGLVFGAAGTAVSHLSTHAFNSQALKTGIAKFEQMVNDHMPNATEVGQKTGALAEKVSKQYQQARDQVVKLASKTAGVNTKPIMDVVKQGEPLATNSTIAGKVLASVTKDLERYAEKPPVAEEAMKSGELKFRDINRLGQAARSQVIQRLGLQIKDSRLQPGIPGDIFHLEAQSQRIKDTVKNLKGPEANSPETRQLENLQSTIDGQIKDFKKNNPVVAAAHKRLGKAYNEAHFAFQDPLIADIANKDPGLRSKAILNLVKTGDTERLNKVNAVLWQSGGKAAKDDAYKVVLHDAYQQSYDKASGEVNAKKFADYFRDENVSKSLLHIESAEGRQMRQGITNLLKDVSKEGIGTHHEISRVGRLAAGYVMGRNLYAMVNAVLAANPATAANHLAAATVGAYGVAKVSNVMDNVLSTRMGKNYLMVASTLRPGSPEMARLVKSMSERLGPIMGAAAGQNSGAAPTSPAQP